MGCHEQTQLAFHWRVGRNLSSEENCSKDRNSHGLRHFATKRNSHFIGELVATYLLRRFVPRVETATDCRHLFIIFIKDFVLKAFAFLI